MGVSWWKREDEKSRGREAKKKGKVREGKEEGKGKEGESRVGKRRQENKEKR